MMTMKVLYDHQIFESQTFGGISRYYYELIKYFRMDDEVATGLSLMFSDNKYLLGDKEIEKQIKHIPGLFGKKHFPGREKMKLIRNALFPAFDSSYQNRRNSIDRLRKGDYDLFHPTYYDDYFLHHMNDKPFVVTMYDLIYELFPTEFPLSERESVLSWKQKVLQNASIIIAISESTKKDIVRIYNIDPDKIEVIYLANSLQLSNEVKKSEYTLPERYLLYVGNRLYYKNFKFFVHSVSALLKDDPGLYLVCTGNECTGEEIELLSSLNIVKKVIFRNSTDAELVELYGNATAFVFPSLYEGFGLPMLEAFSCGCPVIASNTSSLPEVGGDAAQYFNPKDADSIVDAIRKVLSDKEYREAMIKKGDERLNAFSWKTTAEKTKSVYRKVLLTKS